MSLKTFPCYTCLSFFTDSDFVNPKIHRHDKLTINIPRERFDEFLKRVAEA